MISRDNDNEPSRDPRQRMSAAMQPVRIKRFYKNATVEVEPDGFSIRLDGRPVKTPGKRALALPTQALAQAIADEWAAQKTHIDPEAMPLTKMANTAIDAVTGMEGEVAADMAAFAGSDLLCYRAGHPVELIERQQAGWDPILAWAGKTLGIDLQTTVGIMPIGQEGAALEEANRQATSFDALHLTPLHVITTLTGSLILALAHAHGRLDAHEAWALANIDEDWQWSVWGKDEEATERRAKRWVEMEAASRFLALLRQN